HCMSGEMHSPEMSALEVARALLGRGQTLAAIPFIQQAMPHHPEAAAELMAEAAAQIHAIQQVIHRAIADDSPNSAFELAKRASRSVAEIGAALISQRRDSQRSEERRVGKECRCRGARECQREW